MEDAMFISFVVAVVIFLILREFFCWYWKINERTDLLESINNKLSAINSKLSALNAMPNLKESGESVEEGESVE